MNSNSGCICAALIIKSFYQHERHEAARSLARQQYYLNAGSGILMETPSFLADEAHYR
jgi:hypothetical protein